MTFVDEPEPDNLEAEKPDLNAIQRAVEQGRPVYVPWHREIIRLGACFNSRRQGKDAWVEDTPFLLADLVMIPKILRRENGTEATYSSVDTYRLSESNDHLSLGFGVAVGPPGLSALASVSVKGQYDKDVMDNKDVSDDPDFWRSYQLTVLAEVREKFNSFDSQSRSH